MSPLEIMRERRAATKTELDELLALPTEEKRDLTDDEGSKFDALVAEIRKQDERIAELEAQEKRDADAAEARRLAGQTVTATAAVVNEPNPVYRRGDASASFFRDLALVQIPQIGGPLGANVGEARARLVRSQETRAGDMSTAAGAGGEFAPPAWYIDEFIALARPGRVTADLCHSENLPSGISSINLPKVASGSSVAVQATQNSSVSDTAMSTTSVSSGITTLAGKQIVSLQLLQQSGIPFDRVILQDLAKEYAKQVDLQVLYGSNASGQLRGLVGSTVAVNNAFTTTQPAPASSTAANSLYYVLSKAAAAVQTSIFEPADAVVMHPVRWAWILGSVDANSRPLVVPAGPQYNGLGNAGAPAAQGFAGTFGGYNVYLDPNISQTANSATNQDEIYVLRRDELWLYESALQAMSFDATYADQLSILYRVHGYAAFLPHRRAGAVQSIRGIGLITP